jgi:hypothetical protein
MSEDRLHPLELTLAEEWEEKDGAPTVTRRLGSQKGEISTETAPSLRPPLKIWPSGFPREPCGPESEAELSERKRESNFQKGKNITKIHQKRTIFVEQHRVFGIATMT